MRIMRLTGVFTRYMLLPLDYCGKTCVGVAGMSVTVSCCKSCWINSCIFIKPHVHWIPGMSWYTPGSMSCSSSPMLALDIWSLSSKISYHQMLYRLTAVSLGVKIIISIRNLTGVSAAVLLSHLSNFRVIGKLYTIFYNILISGDVVVRCYMLDVEWFSSSGTIVVT